MLACKNANSKLAEVVTVANVDDKDRVGNNWLQISRSWGLVIELNLLDSEAQGLVKILKLKFRQDF